MPLITSGSLSMDFEFQSGSSCSGPIIVFRGPPQQQITVSIWRVNESGPHSYLSAPTVSLDANGEYRNPLMGMWPDGLYLAWFKLSSETPTDLTDIDPNEGHPFELAAGCLRIPSKPSETLAAALAAQAAFRDREVRAKNFTEQNRLTLHVIVEGCNLDYAQPFEGGHLRPLSQRLGPESLVAVVNELLESGPPFYADVLREAYSRGHPLCLVTFVNVQAPGISEAVDAVRARLDRVLGALAEDRSAHPQILAYLSVDQARRYNLTFPLLEYRGNRVKGIGPGVTSLLDLVNAATEADPWIDFALNLMRSVRLQTSVDVQLFQSWSLIEAAAKRSVPSERHVLVLDDQGQAISTGRGPLNQSRDIGRVIVYLRDCVGRNQLMFSAMSGKPNLYEGVRMLHDARNRVAHEGGLTVPGSKPMTADTFELAFVAKDCAAKVLHHEIRRAASLANPVPKSL